MRQRAPSRAQRSASSAERGGRREARGDARLCGDVQRQVVGRPELHVIDVLQRDDVPAGTHADQRSPTDEAERLGGPITPARVDVGAVDAVRRLRHPAVAEADHANAQTDDEGDHDPQRRAVAGPEPGHPGDDDRGRQPQQPGPRERDRHPRRAEPESEAPHERLPGPVHAEHGRTDREGEQARQVVRVPEAPSAGRGRAEPVELTVERERVEREGAPGQGLRDAQEGLGAADHDDPAEQHAAGTVPRDAPDQIRGGGRGRDPGEELQPTRRGVDRQGHRFETHRDRDGPAERAAAQPDGLATRTAAERSRHPDHEDRDGGDVGRADRHPAVGVGGDARSGPQDRSHRERHERDEQDHERQPAGGGILLARIQPRSRHLERGRH